VNGQVSDAQTIVGNWSGQTQFQGAQNGQVIEEAHSVVPMVLTFSSDGKVSGSSADNGCSLLGLWAPGSTPRLFMLDITLTGCRYSGLNRRYTGSLIATFPDNSAQLSLLAYAMPILGQPVRRYDVGATLRR
jgi:FlaG/FlaF family flagellin (archaellin)